ncbi:hypothetical protein WN55_07982 [Dufourea novaeangliae]|nr:hypothetical protein WN55_07982 [Dufourea novaeangliae]
MLSRELVVTINRCRTDHYNLAASLSRIGVINEPTCECGNAIQDVNHIIWQCCLYNSQRSKLIRRLQKIKLYPPLSIDMIIAEPNIPACSYVHSFLKNCNLKI